MEQKVTLPTKHFFAHVSERDIVIADCCFSCTRSALIDKTKETEELDCCENLMLLKRVKKYNVCARFQRGSDA